MVKAVSFNIYSSLNSEYYISLKAMLNNKLKAMIYPLN